MIEGPLLFLPSGNLGDWLMRGLAVVGAAALGGFGAGLILQLSARLTTTRPAPRPVLRLVRILGAIACGLLVATLLFHAGGPGGGGSGTGGGKDSAKGEYVANLAKDAAPPKERAKSDMPANQSELRIVVLARTDGRNYRVEGDPHARTLDEVEALVKERRAQQPPLRNLVIVVYQDSPSHDHPIVEKLKELAKSSGLTPEISLPEGQVP